MPGEGLFHQPLIVEGKRNRRSVDRFGSSPMVPTVSTTTTRRSSIAPQMFEGSGIALSDIEKVKQGITSMEATQLKPLHKILFGTPGRVATLKGDIEQFNGFPFSIGSADHGKKKVGLGKLSLFELQTMGRVLGLGGEAPKDQMITLILEFLMNPKKPTESEKTAAALKKRPSNEHEAGNSKKKRPRESESPRREPGLQLSESSSDEEMEEEIPVMPAAKPKKRVSFEEEHRLVQVEGEARENEPKLVEDPMTDDGSGDDGDIPEKAKQTIQKLIDEVPDVKKVTLGWLINETVKVNPELATRREIVRDHAIKVLRSMVAPAV